MANVLYFEGAGMDFYSEEQTKFSDVGNFRIRTAFRNLDGEKIYLEIGNAPIYGKDKKVSRFALHIDFLFKIVEGESDNCNKNRIKFDYAQIRQLDYTKKSITNWINKNLNCNFDTIEVLDYFHGYRVHADNRYNLMDNFEVNHNRATKRKAAYEKIDMEYRKLLNEKYSKINLQEMDNNSITIRCYASDQALGNIPRVKRIEID